MQWPRQLIVVFLIDWSNRVCKGDGASGSTYRIEFVVHDGDQTKVGGDSGEACVIVTAP
jgi:hypothetical protein